MYRLELKTTLLSESENLEDILNTLKNVIYIRTKDGVYYVIINGKLYNEIGYTRIQLINIIQLEIEKRTSKC